MPASVQAFADRVNTRLATFCATTQKPGNHALMLVKQTADCYASKLIVCKSGHINKGARIHD
jgi:hypothetical protein